MKKQLLSYGLALVLTVLGLTSCYEEPDFALEPNLSFRDLEQRTLRNPTNVRYDSLILVVRFQDGDGNLGLSETLCPEDIQGDFRVGGDYFYNIFCKLYKKENGSFVPVLGPGDTPISYDGRFPRITTENRVEPLEGDIRYSINIFETANRNSPIKAGDTLRFDAKIVDRAKNESNTVASSEFILFSK